MNSTKTAVVGAPFLLTKSLFQMACTCPRKLRYALFPDLYPTNTNNSSSSNDNNEDDGNAFLKNLAQEGRKVELYARHALFFPRNDHQIKSILIGSNINKSTTTNFSDLAEQTKQALLLHPDDDDDDDSAQKETVVFEGVIQTNSFLHVRADILHCIRHQHHHDHGKKKKEIRLLECKAKSWDSRKSRDEQFLGKTGNNIQASFLPYLRDVAFQKYVLQQALSSYYDNDDDNEYTISAWLVLPDKAKINTMIPYLNALLTMDHLDQDNKNNNNNEQATRQIKEIIEHSGSVGECLVTEVPVDDLVDRILYQDNVRGIPGLPPPLSSAYTLENVILDCQEYIQRLNHHTEQLPWKLPTKTSTTTLQPQAPVQRLGSHCKSCEFRVETSDKNDDHNDNISINVRNDKTRKSGFDECWGPVLEARNGDKSSSSSSSSSLVIDLWNALPKQVDKFLQQEKYFMRDLHPEQDFGILLPQQQQQQQGNKRIMTTVVDPKQKTLATKKKSNHNSKSNKSAAAPLGMSRSQRQWYQVVQQQHQQQQQVLLDRAYMQVVMSQWQYPFHFIDFETVTPALPYCTGMAPYQLLAYQFSHHILSSPVSSSSSSTSRLDCFDLLPQHATEFLNVVPGNCPNVAFLEALAQALITATTNDGVDGGGRGTVFRWGAHENTVLQALLANHQAEISSTTRDVLQPLLTTTPTAKRGASNNNDDDDDGDGDVESRGDGSGAMVDLMQVAAKGYFVTGSSSLKKLLQPTMQVSRRLRDIYSTQAYSSNNFSQMYWWQTTNDSGKDKNKNNNNNTTTTTTTVLDPYTLLAGDDGKESDNVTQGGDAIVAYNLLQKPETDPTTRAKIKRSLLRYCEVDTLAMAMMVQAWQGFLQDGSGGDDDDSNKEN